MILGLLEEAKGDGSLKEDADVSALSHLVISSIEGALILHRVLAEPEPLEKTRDALKLVISLHRLEGGEQQREDVSGRTRTRSQFQGAPHGTKPDETA
jgi:hypothetical protein